MSENKQVQEVKFCYKGQYIDNEKIVEIINENGYDVGSKDFCKELIKNYLFFLLKNEKTIKEKGEDFYRYFSLTLNAIYKLGLIPYIESFLKEKGITKSFKVLILSTIEDENCVAQSKILILNALTGFKGEFIGSILNNFREQYKNRENFIDTFKNLIIQTFKDNLDSYQIDIYRHQGISLAFNALYELKFISNSKIKDLVTELKTDKKYFEAIYDVLNNSSNSHSISFVLNFLVEFFSEDKNTGIIFSEKSINKEIVKKSILKVLKDEKVELQFVLCAIKTCLFFDIKDMEINEEVIINKIKEAFKDNNIKNIVFAFEILYKLVNKTNGECLKNINIQNLNKVLSLLFEFLQTDDRYKTIIVKSINNILENHSDKLKGLENPFFIEEEEIKQEKPIKQEKQTIKNELKIEKEKKVICNIQSDNLENYYDLKKISSCILEELKLESIDSFEIDDLGYKFIINSGENKFFIKLEEKINFITKENLEDIRNGISILELKQNFVLIKKIKYQNVNYIFVIGENKEIKEEINKISGNKEIVYLNIDLKKDSINSFINYIIINSFKKETVFNKTNKWNNTEKVCSSIKDYLRENFISQKIKNNIQIINNCKLNAYKTLKDKVIEINNKINNITSLNDDYDNIELNTYNLETIQEEVFDKDIDSDAFILLLKENKKYKDVAVLKVKGKDYYYKLPCSIVQYTSDNIKDIINDNLGNKNGLCIVYLDTHYIAIKKVVSKKDNKTYIFVLDSLNKQYKEIDSLANNDKNVEIIYLSTPLSQQDENTLNSCAIWSIFNCCLLNKIEEKDLLNIVKEEKFTINDINIEINIINEINEEEERKIMMEKNKKIEEEELKKQKEEELKKQKEERKNKIQKNEKKNENQKVQLLKDNKKNNIKRNVTQNTYQCNIDLQHIVNTIKSVNPKDDNFDNFCIKVNEMLKKNIKKKEKRENIKNKNTINLFEYICSYNDYVEKYYNETKKKDKYNKYKEEILKEINDLDLVKFILNEISNEKKIDFKMLFSIFDFYLFSSNTKLITNKEILPSVFKQVLLSISQNFDTLCVFINYFLSNKNNAEKKEINELYKLLLKGDKQKFEVKIKKIVGNSIKIAIENNNNNEIDCLISNINCCKFLSNLFFEAIFSETNNFKGQILNIFYKLPFGYCFIDNLYGCDQEIFNVIKINFAIGSLKQKNMAFGFFLRFNKELRKNFIQYINKDNNKKEGEVLLDNIIMIIFNKFLNIENKSDRDYLDMTAIIANLFFIDINFFEYMDKEQKEILSDSIIVLIKNKKTYDMNVIIFDSIVKFIDMDDKYIANAILEKIESYNMYNDLSIMFKEILFNDNKVIDNEQDIFDIISVLCKIHDYEECFIKNIINLFSKDDIKQLKKVLGNLIDKEKDSIKYAVYLDFLEYVGDIKGLDELLEKADNKLSQLCGIPNKNSLISENLEKASADINSRDNEFKIVDMTFSKEYIIKNEKCVIKEIPNKNDYIVEEVNHENNKDDDIKPIEIRSSFNLNSGNTYKKGVIRELSVNQLNSKNLDKAIEEINSTKKQKEDNKKGGIGQN